jgi:hypothetical protein
MRAITQTVLVIIVTAVWSSGCGPNSSPSPSAPADQTKASDKDPGDKPAVPKNAIKDDGTDKSAPPPNLMVIGASSLLPPLGQLPQLLRAMFDSKGIPMHVEGKWPPLDALSRMKSSKLVWDYVIIDAWNLARGRTDSPDWQKTWLLSWSKSVLKVPSVKSSCLPGGSLMRRQQMRTSWKYFSVASNRPN